ncbi:MAG: ribosome assembly RNA-binding protein YhbY [Tissierellia bacterium]|nr:ribosome assembly RNA-binding protein YhbY [Tissierellia bacterium]
MISGKQRSYLKKLAHNMSPKLNIGKNGISDSLIDAIDELLEARELVKINILKNNSDEADKLIEEILDKTGSVFVQFIGGKLVIYRPSIKNKKIDLDKI